MISKSRHFLSFFFFFSFSRLFQSGKTSGCVCQDSCCGSLHSSQLAKNDDHGSPSPAHIETSRTQPAARRPPRSSSQPEPPDPQGRKTVPQRGPQNPGRCPTPPSAAAAPSGVSAAAAGVWGRDLVCRESTSSPRGRVGREITVSSLGIGSQPQVLQFEAFPGLICSICVLVSALLLRPPGKSSWSLHVVSPLSFLERKIRKYLKHIQIHRNI